MSDLFETVSDDDFEEGKKHLNKWENNVQTKLKGEEERKQRRKRKLPLSSITQDSKKSVVSGGGDGIMFGKKCSDASPVASAQSNFVFGDFEDVNADTPKPSCSKAVGIGELVAAYSQQTDGVDPKGSLISLLHENGDLENPSLPLSTSGPSIVNPSSHTKCVIDGEDMTSSSVDKVIGGGDGGKLELSGFDCLSFNSYEEFAEAQQEMEISTITSYISKCKTLKGTKGLPFTQHVSLIEYLKTIKDKKDILLYWKYGNEKSGDPIPIKFNGTPFLYLNKRVYSCHQGPDYNKKANDGKKKKKHSQLMGANSGTDISEHFDSVIKTKKSIQNTKKLGCPVSYTVKQVLYFPQYSVGMEARQYKLKDTLSKLKNELMKLKSTTDDLVDENSLPPNTKVIPNNGDSHDIATQLVYLTKFPKIEEHKYHFKGGAAGVGEKTDPRVVAYIKKLGRNKNKNKTEIDKLIKTYVRATWVQDLLPLILK